MVRIRDTCTLTVLALRENRPARELLRRLGFRPRRSAGAQIELELVLGSPAASVAT